MLGTNPDGPITTGGDTAQGDVYGSVSARVQAVVDFYGPTELAALEEESRGVPGGGAVPRRQAQPGPPELRGRVAGGPCHCGQSADVDLQGTADTLIPPDQPQALASALSSAGVPNRVISVAGALRFRISGVGPQISPGYP